MADIDFQNVFNQLKDEVKNLAVSTIKDYKDEASRDAFYFLNMLEENLKEWTQLLAKGELSGKDFEYLVLGQKELMEMNGLKRAGLSQIKTNEFKNNLLNLVIHTVIKLV